MQRGLVFKDANGNVVLMTVHGKEIVEAIISDYDGLYDSLPESSADIVEVDDYAENTGNVALCSICGVNFGYDESLQGDKPMMEIKENFSAPPVPARTALREAAQQDIRVIVELVENAKKPDEIHT